MEADQSEGGVGGPGRGSLGMEMERECGDSAESLENFLIGHGGQLSLVSRVRTHAYCSNETLKCFPQVYSDAVYASQPFCVSYYAINKINLRIRLIRNFENKKKRYEKNNTDRSE